MEKLNKWVGEKTFGTLGEFLGWAFEKEWRQNAFLIAYGLLAIFVFVAPALLYSQPKTEMPKQPVVAVNELPDAPMPAMESSSSNMSFTSAGIASQTFRRPTPIKKHRWLTAYNFSLLTLAVGETVDSLGTYENMTHPKWLCGYDSLWPTWGYAISTNDHVTYDEASVKSICGVSPAGVQPNYMFDVTQTNSFMEGGWAAKWKLTGNRNYAGVEAWNLGNDVAQALVAHYLHKKGGWKGKVGTGMNYWHGIGHLGYGISNFRYISQNCTPAEWAKNNPKGFTWSPPYWWGKK
jgi:hypothetical protein